MSNVRSVALAACLVALGSVTPAVTQPIRNAIQSISERYDPRPERAILFIGNSRTYYHDIPHMVRLAADSAGAREKYKITVRAQGGATLQYHWRAPSTRATFAQKWQDIIIQAQSSEQLDADSESNFQDHGAKLIELAAQNSARPSLYVTWRYAKDFAELADRPDLLAHHHDLIQSAHRKLAARTGADIINVGEAWSDVESHTPKFSLYDDGNHPSIHGSFLAALVIFGHLNKGGIERVTFVPRGISASDAALLRRIASQQ